MLRTRVRTSVRVWPSAAGSLGRRAWRRTRRPARLRRHKRKRESGSEATKRHVRGTRTSQNGRKPVDVGCKNYAASLKMSTFAPGIMVEFPMFRVVFRGGNNANPHYGISCSNANNDASNSNADVGSRLANYQSVPRQGGTCPSIPHRGGQATAKAHIKWKAETSSVG